MKIAKGDGMLVTYALGSCIGLCFHDPRLRLGALLHIMLPLNMEPGRKNPLKYADTGIRETLRQLETQGASRSRITVKICSALYRQSATRILGVPAAALIKPSRIIGPPSVLNFKSIIS